MEYSVGQMAVNGESYCYVNGYNKARLITKDEWNNILASVPNVPVELHEGWWTFSSPAVDKAVYVTRTGLTRTIDSYRYSGVRVLFEIKGKTGYVCALKTGSKIKVGDVTCTVTEVKRNPFQQVYNISALSDKIIAYQTFDEIGEYIESERFRQLVTGTYEV